MSKAKKPAQESAGPTANTSGPLAQISRLDDNNTKNSAITLIKTRESMFTKVTGNGLTSPNWVTWRVHMMSLFALCKVELYVREELERPNIILDPIGYQNWTKNDNYTHHLITQNVSDEVLVHIQQGATSSIVWKNLASIYCYNFSLSYLQTII